ncbi:MAG: archaeal proteasome endopeptidase complex subunit alpha [Thermoplasmatota archaeon]
MDKDHYDQAATVFSPDGRVYQVEYSREAIKRGGLALGIMYKDGVLFTIDKSIFSPLIEEDNLEKFFKITSSVGAAASGLIADARVLIDILRDKAQLETRRYGETPDVRNLVMWISRIYEVYTRYEGVRPFGTALIVGGHDDQGFHLYETDPSGVFQERKATAVGKGSGKAIEILEKTYVPDLSREEAIGLAVRILEETLQERLQDIRKGEEIHIISRDGFEVLDLDADVDLEEILQDVDLGRVHAKDVLSDTAEEMEGFLDGIPRLTSEAKKNLKDAFGDLEGLKKAGEKELLSVQGIGKATAKRILKALGELD